MPADEFCHGRVTTFADLVGININDADLPEVA